MDEARLLDIICQRLSIGSRVNREVHARFWERLGVRFPRRLAKTVSERCAPPAGKTAVIPPRANRLSLRDYDRQLYGARHLIENFFAKIKQFRAIATGSEKTARNFLAAVQLIASVVWLN